MACVGVLCRPYCRWCVGQCGRLVSVLLLWFLAVVVVVAVVAAAAAVVALLLLLVAAMVAVVLLLAVWAAGEVMALRAVMAMVAHSGVCVRTCVRVGCVCVCGA